jgi:mRNA interferase RelE/StbE
MWSFKKSGKGLGEKRTCSMASGIKYRIEFAPAATRQFKKLPRDVQVRISRRIDTLAETPRPAGVKKLEDEASLYRIRVGDYRVIYTIQDKLRLVLVVTLGKRADVYR